MGRGLVDPVDDLRATNPASNEELLAALSKDFVEHGYDVRRLIRTIADNLGIGTIKDDGTGAVGVDNDTPTLSASSPTVTASGSRGPSSSDP